MFVGFHDPVIMYGGLHDRRILASVSAPSLFVRQGGRVAGITALDLFGQQLFGPSVGSMAADFRQFFEQGPGFNGHEEQEPRQPATSEAALRAIPSVKVTQYDIDQNENCECVICLDNLAVGESAIRTPCGHLFHESCAKNWLKSSNQCPMCRLELPTDDPVFESGRRARMANRKLRLRARDLFMKSVAELRYLAQYLGVDLVGCLEKRDIVESVVKSGRVELIEDLPPAVPAEPSDSAHSPVKDVSATCTDDCAIDTAAGSSVPAEPSDSAHAAVKDVSATCTDDRADDTAAGSSAQHSMLEILRDRGLKRSCTQETSEDEPLISEVCPEAPKGTTPTSDVPMEDSPKALEDRHP